MNKLVLILGISGLTMLYSCKSDTDKAKDVVNGFLIEIKSGDKKFPLNFMEEDYYDFMKDKRVYFPEKWKLAIKQETDSIILIACTSETRNVFGGVFEHIQGFALSNKSGNWRIYSSLQFVEETKLNFEIVDDQWDSYWDMKKNRILNEIQKNLRLEVLIQGYNSSSSYVRGKLRIVNDSDYDIKGIKILIEHFDSSGKSVNTDIEYVLDIIRKNGYRDYEWLTIDCDNCVKQLFKINF